MILQTSKSIQSSGRTGELAFALAHSFGDKFYFGGTLGIPIIKYNYQATYSEYDYKNIEVWVSLNNIFGTHYFAYGSSFGPYFGGPELYYPAPTRNVQVGVKVKF